MDILGPPVRQPKMKGFGGSESDDSPKSSPIPSPSSKPVYAKEVLKSSSHNAIGSFEKVKEADNSEGDKCCYCTSFISNENIDMELTLAQPLPPTPPKPKSTSILHPEVDLRTVKAQKLIAFDSSRERETMADMTLDNPTIQPQTVLVSFFH